MAKFYGAIGFATTSETSPGIFTEVIIEKNYSGDVLQDNQRWESSDKHNDNLVIANRISIVGDPYLHTNLYALRYVKWQDVLWKVTKIEIQRPRLILTIGGVYNEQT